MDNIVSGSPYGIRLAIDPTATTNFHDADDGTQYQLSLTVNNNTLYNQDFTATELNTVDDTLSQFIQ